MRQTTPETISVTALFDRNEISTSFPTIKFVMKTPNFGENDDATCLNNCRKMLRTRPILIILYAQYDILQESIPTHYSNVIIVFDTRPQ